MSLASVVSLFLSLPSQFLFSVLLGRCVCPSVFLRALSAVTHAGDGHSKAGAAMSDPEQAAATVRFHSFSPLFFLSFSLSLCTSLPLSQYPSLSVHLCNAKRITMLSHRCPLFLFFSRSTFSPSLSLLLLLTAAQRSPFPSCTQAAVEEVISGAAAAESLAEILPARYTSLTFTSLHSSLFLHSLSLSTFNVSPFPLSPPACPRFPMLSTRTLPFSDSLTLPRFSPFLHLVLVPHTRLSFSPLAPKPSFCVLLRPLPTPLPLFGRLLPSPPP